MSLAWNLLGLVLAAIAPRSGGYVSTVERPPKAVESASTKDCEVFAAVGAQRLGWVTQRSREALLVDVEEPKATYRVNCPWGKLGVKGPRAATPSDATVFRFLRPQYTVDGNVATFWIEQGQNTKGGPATWKEQFHVGKRNYGGKTTYWVVY